MRYTKIIFAQLTKCKVVITLMELNKIHISSCRLTAYYKQLAYL